jgi:methionyl-tRNA formyltransferase
VLALLAETEPDLIVSWFWTQRIPSTVVALAAKGGVNVHPSLLPRHRGPDPYFWTIMSGDRETGVTAHWITSQYDAGDVVLQRRMAVPETCNAGQLSRVLDRLSLEVLRDTLAAIAVNDAPAVPQNAALATLAPRPADEECEIVWDAPVDEVLRRVRACAPDPGAFTGFGNETVVVLRAKEASVSLRGLNAGDIVRTSEGVSVACRGGAVVLVEVQRESNGERFVGDEVASVFPGIATLTR